MPVCCGFAARGAQKGVFEDAGFAPAPPEPLCPVMVPPRPHPVSTMQMTAPVNIFLILFISDAILPGRALA